MKNPYRPIHFFLCSLFSTLIIFGCSSPVEVPTPTQEIPSQKMNSTSQKALFAGGCFWCMEPPFDKLPGVISTTSGFAGGKKANPNYQEVAKGQTQHVEAVLVEFNPKLVSFEKLLDVYWRQVDPTDGEGQFVDRGPQYRPVIYFYSKEQLLKIQQSKKNIESKKIFKKPLAVEITPYTTFYPAEDYHQDYYQKSSFKYKYYRFRSGRDQYLEKIWGKNKKR